VSIHMASPVINLHHMA